MSSETAFPEDSPTDPVDDQPPVPEQQPEEPDPTPVPDPIPAPSEPILYEPRMWYSITWTCKTVDCRNENLELSAPMMYSNDGIHLGVYCGLCSKKGTILTATLLDPQPEPE